MLFVHAMNDTARTQEEKGFKEGVGHDVKNAGHIIANTHGYEHEAKLADR